MIGPMLEIIFEDNQNTIKKEENFYFESLLLKKFLYNNNKITKVFEYKYNDKRILQETEEYDYQTYIQIFNLDFKQKRKRKEKRN
ncbi:hypothetical protein CWO85_03355 [Candidatus Phytoplasma ziziphi]|uniref:Uncharacterized protein n=1 Tax=Ziziphus jujuba witches'-broom phytoplasma TaxID=135727 RepID=A0A660HM99_ZIZJU|nr:hypothetical protein [Candidatus Phytoplasma ziziphi]AYJ01158.1 hypothetical protein CWO85_01245 [Candidatus Phytoplasma ziziphi]AYJ01513.1 hypothetical protein CWO85_03355 [Candidatus Phytoplasma ziziphi]